MVLAKGKEMPNEEVEAPKGNQETVTEEPKGEEKKAKVKEIPVESRDTVEAVKRFLDEQKEDFDLELGDAPIHLSTLSQI